MSNTEETIEIFGRSFVLKSSNNKYDIHDVASILNDEMEYISNSQQDSSAFINVLLAAALNLAQRTLEQEQEIEALSNILEGE